MAVIRWNPLNLSNFFEDDFELPTIQGLSRLGQGLNLYETEDKFIAEAALPGIFEDQVDISVEDKVVRISATSSEKQEEKEQRRYFMSSMATAYNYSFRLPDSIADNEPEASMDNGILTLIFKKIEKAPPKKIAIKRRGQEKKDK